MTLQPVITLADRIKFSKQAIEYSYRTNRIAHLHIAEADIETLLVECEDHVDQWDFWGDGWRVILDDPSSMTP